MKTISDIFTEIDTEITEDNVSVDRLLEALHERGFGFLLLLFSVPMALPLPVPPGINVLLASPLILLTGQQALGRHTIWLPGWMRKKSMKKESLSDIINKALPWFKRLEKLIKPRLEFITQGVFSHIIGVLGLIMALSVCVPLPLTNTVPSFGIALMSVGVIMRDGLAVITGAVIGTVWVCALSFAIIYFGMEGIEIVKDFIKGLF